MTIIGIIGELIGVLLKGWVADDFMLSLELIALVWIPPLVQVVVGEEDQAGHTCEYTYHRL